MLYNKKIFKRVFSYNKKYWYKNLTQIPRYFRTINYLVKNGYDGYAEWETYYWFIETMRNILTEYRKDHTGYPCGITCEEWEANIDEMISLLNDMDELNPKYKAEEYQMDFHGNKLQDVMKVDEEMEKAKDKFFKLFAEHFYSLWD